MTEQNDPAAGEHKQDNIIFLKSHLKYKTSSGTFCLLVHWPMETHIGDESTKTRFAGGEEHGL
jgi:hypothetical protein